MSSTILRAKLFVPNHAEAGLPRPRIHQRLQSGLSRRLTLVLAPAGFGKSFAVAQWAKTCSLPVAWVSLDSEDAELSQFLLYLVLAYQSIFPGKFEGIVDHLLRSSDHSAPSIVSHLLVELEDVDARSVLILDDYHEVQNPQINQAVSYLIEYLLPGMHVVIVSREDPQLALGRARTLGRVNEIRIEDLRFRTDEAKAFLQQTMSLALDDRDIARLEAASEGWIVGLQLAAISLQNHPDPARFIENFSGTHRYVIDYLLEEVLNHQSPEVMDFLLKVSSLDRFCGSLCEVVADLPAGLGDEFLDRLERANLFLIPLDDRREWFRFHRLFSDLLRKKNHFAGPKLLLKASAWYEDRGLDIEAFRLAAQAGDFSSCARLAEGKGSPIVFRGGSIDYLKWFAGPIGFRVKDNPELCIWAISAVDLSGDFQHAQVLIDWVDDAIGADSSTHELAELKAHVEAQRARIACVVHDRPKIEAHAHRALELASPENATVRIAAQWALAYAFEMKKEFEPAFELYRQSFAMSRASGNLMMMIMNRLGISFLQLYQNEFSNSEEGFREVLSWAGEPPLPLAGLAYYGIAQIQYNRLEFDEAHRSIQMAQTMLDRINGADWPVIAQILLTRIELAMGRFEAAVQSMQSVERMAVGAIFEGLGHQILTLKSRIFLRWGRVKDAQYALRGRMISRAQIRLDLAQKRPHDALRLVQKELEGSVGPLWPFELESRQWMLALALYECGDLKAAFAKASEVVQRCQATEMAAILIEDGDVSIRLLTELKGKGVAPQWIDSILEKAYPSLRSEPSGAPNEPRSILSPREREVLDLVSQGLSNEEISERLFVSLSTIKGHNQRIFEKLGVQRRTEAVSVARRKGWL